LAGQAPGLRFQGTVHYLCFMANKLKSNTPKAAEKPIVKDKAEKAVKAAKKKPVPQKFQNDKEEKVDLQKLAKDDRTWKITGTISLLISIFLFIAFVSYLFTWDDDQSQVMNQGASFLWNNDKETEVSNLLGRLGAYAAHNLIYNGFGLASFLFCTFFFVVGINLLFTRRVFSIWRNLKYVTIGLLIVSISFSFLFAFANFPYGGKVGDMISTWLIGLLGTVGTATLLIVIASCYIIWQFNPSFNLPERKLVPVNDDIGSMEGAKLTVDTSLTNGRTVNDVYADEAQSTISEKGNLLKGEGGMVLDLDDEETNNGYTLTEKEDAEEEEELKNLLKKK